MFRLIAAVIVLSSACAHAQTLTPQEQRIVLESECEVYQKIVRVYDDVGRPTKTTLGAEWREKLRLCQLALKYLNESTACEANKQPAAPSPQGPVAALTPPAAPPAEAQQPAPTPAPAVVDEPPEYVWPQTITLLPRPRPHAKILVRRPKPKLSPAKPADPSFPNQPLFQPWQSN